MASAAASPGAASSRRFVCRPRNPSFLAAGGGCSARGLYLAVCDHLVSYFPSWLLRQIPSPLRTRAGRRVGCDIHHISSVLVLPNPGERMVGCRALPRLARCSGYPALRAYGTPLAPVRWCGLCLRSAGLLACTCHMQFFGHLFPIGESKLIWR